MRYGAIVLAGGAGRRMGGPSKPLLEVRGVPMLHRVLAALADAEPVVVVGPPDLASALPSRVRLTREDPPGGGPVAGTAAGLTLCDGCDFVAVVAADLPFLTAQALTVLTSALAEGGDAALYCDKQSRRQSLCAVWRAGALEAVLAGQGMAVQERAGSPVPGKGLSMRALLAAADVVEVPWAGAGTPPWFDCDTPDELARAEELR